jgi:hypothetical protein
MALDIRLVTGMRWITPFEMDLVAGGRRCTDTERR